MDPFPSSSSSDSSGDEDSVHSTMGRPHSGSRGPPRRVEIDLTGVLSIEQKNQLVTLVNIILEGMHLQLLEIFEVIGKSRDEKDEFFIIDPPTETCHTIPNPRSKKYAHLYDMDPTSSDDEKDPEKDGAKSILDPLAQAPLNPVFVAAAAASDGPLKIPETIQQATTLYFPGGELEIFATTNSELKKDFVTSFGKWRTNVARRMLDIVIDTDMPVKAAGAASGQGQRRSHGSMDRGRTAGSSASTGSAHESNKGTEEVNKVIFKTNVPTPTPLSTLPKEKRALISHLMMLLLLGLENYCTYSRLLLKFVGFALCVPRDVLVNDEKRVAKALSMIIKGIPIAEIIQKRTEEAKRRFKPLPRSQLVSDLTDGLPPSMVEAGVGSVFGGSESLGRTATASLLGMMAESTVVVGLLFGLYGARATGRMVDSYSKDIADFAFLPCRSKQLIEELIDPKDLPAEDRRLRSTLCVGGWLADKDDIRTPWLSLCKKGEVYVLRWEVDSLVKFGNSLTVLSKSPAYTEAKKTLGEKSVTERLWTASWPAALVKASKIIENSFTVGVVRAEKAGQILADAILNKVQGERPITLIGYSIGARVIYSCLMTLMEKRAFGYIENVIFMGAPIPADAQSWTAIRTIIAGRLVNVFSRKDYLLGFMHRTSNYTFGVAGLQKVKGVWGVENFDATVVVSNHICYRYMVGSLLKRLDMDYTKGDLVGIEEDQLRDVMDSEDALDQARATAEEQRKAVAKAEAEAARKAQAAVKPAVVSKAPTGPKIRIGPKAKTANPGPKKQGDTWGKLSNTTNRSGPARASGKSSGSDQQAQGSGSAGSKTGSKKKRHWKFKGGKENKPADGSSQEHKLPLRGDTTQGSGRA